jgi:hypothetical protein
MRRREFITVLGIAAASWSTGPRSWPDLPAVGRNSPVDKEGLGAARQCGCNCGQPQPPRGTAGRRPSC